MRICLLCQFPFWPDDQVIAAANSRRCICIRCFAHATDTGRPIPRPLWQMVDAALADETLPADVQKFLDG